MGVGGGPSPVWRLPGPDPPVVARRSPLPGTVGPQAPLLPRPVASCDAIRPGCGDRRGTIMHGIRRACPLARPRAIVMGSFVTGGEERRGSDTGGGPARFGTRRAAGRVERDEPPSCRSIGIGSAPSKPPQLRREKGPRERSPSRPI